MNYLREVVGVAPRFASTPGLVGRKPSVNNERSRFQRRSISWGGVGELFQLTNKNVRKGYRTIGGLDCRLGKLGEAPTNKNGPMSG